MDALFHSREEIERALARLHRLPTDNREAPLALGFHPLYPQLTKGYESRLWARSIDSAYGSSLSNGRKLLIQLDYFEEKKLRR
jgi:hypothetical protein